MLYNRKLKVKLQNSETLTLYIKENDFLTIAVMILRAYNVLSSVFQFDSVNNEGVIVAVVPLHEFDGLP